MKLAVTVCATASYTYAMGAQARRVAANVQAASVDPGTVILVGDESSQLKEVEGIYQTVMPEGWKIIRVADASLKEDVGENYKERAQLLIAMMREQAFACARKLGMDFVWSLDSDVLPPANALRCSLDMLRFDNGYYSIASCPYPNGMWLGGRGTYTQPIAQDFTPEERRLPWKLARLHTALEKRLRGEVVPSWPEDNGVDHERPWRKAKWVQRPEKPTPEDGVKLRPQSFLRLTMEREAQRAQRIREKINECPPAGNVWEIIAKFGWRKRGWLDFAYPAIGRGAVVPSDWCGFGCTLLNRSALELANFEGYDGKGTEDLHCIWRHWAPAGLRICCITHCPCSHVIWHKKKVNGKTSEEDAKKAVESYVLLDAYHEPEGECVGHLRMRELPWTPERISYAQKHELSNRPAKQRK